MRMAFFVGAAALAGLSAAAPATAATYPWCARYSSSAGECSFQTRQQCLDDVSGIGGVCTQNPGYSGPTQASGPYNYVPPGRGAHRHPVER